MDLPVFVLYPGPALNTVFIENKGLITLSNAYSEINLQTNN
jgi:hypothetical protein